MTTTLSTASTEHETPLPPASLGNSRSVESRDPSNGEVWRSFPTTSPAEVEAAVARARAAQPAWAAAPLGDRVRVLRRFHESLYRRRREVADIITRENGKPFAEALSAEIVITLDFTNYYAAEAPRFLRGSWKTGATMGMMRKRVKTLRDPHGVIGVIAPWNYPFLLGAAEIIPALVTGNAVLLKPSEFTPSCGAILGDLFTEAGLPRDLLTVLQGDGSTGAALTNAAVDKIFFTGSVATGRKIAETCGRRLIPCSLELGGSDAALVLADANVAHAARGIAWGRFSNSGQTCVAPKRVFADAAVYDEFVAELSRVVNALRVGPGASMDTDVVAVIRPSSVETLTAQRDDALGRGARVAASAAIPANSGGSYFPPTVLVNVAAESRVLNEETFGPLLPVVKVNGDDDAVARANASDFGLSASVWSRSTSHASAVAARLVTGSVTLNDAIIVPGMVEVPHGGVKSSGIGRAHGLEGLEECVRPKPVVADQFTGWRQAWWFGYSKEHADGLDAFVRLAHSKGMFERLAAIPAVVRLLFRPRRPL